MIFDHIANSATYQGISARFDLAFAYLRDFKSETPIGRYDLDGDRVYALVQSIQTSPAASGVFESHQIYADIHYVFSGQEVIYYAQTPLLKPRGDYDASVEARLYDGADDSALRLTAGCYAAFWPQDGHKPGCQAETSSTVQKVVMKIKLIG